MQYLVIFPAAVVVRSQSPFLERMRLDKITAPVGCEAKTSTDVITGVTKFGSASHIPAARLYPARLLARRGPNTTMLEPRKLKLRGGTVLKVM